MLQRVTACSVVFSLFVTSSAYAAQPLRFYYRGAEISVIQGNTQSSSDFLVGSQRLTHNQSVLLSDGKSLHASVQGDIIKSSHDFAPYGSSHTPDLTFGYNGEYQDSSTRFVYLRARDYDPSQMRFMSMDRYPLLNRYQFANQDPINHIDPSGHISWGKALGFFAGFGLIGGGAYATYDGAKHHRWGEMAGGIVGVLAGVAISGYNLRSNKIINQDESLTDILPEENSHFDSVKAAKDAYLAYLSQLLDDQMGLLNNFENAVEFMDNPNEPVSYNKYTRTLTNIRPSNTGRISIQFLEKNNRFDILDDPEQLTRWVKLQDVLSTQADADLVSAMHDFSDNPHVEAIRAHHRWITSSIIVHDQNPVIGFVMNNIEISEAVDELILEKAFN